MCMYVCLVYVVDVLPTQLLFSHVMLTCLLHSQSYVLYLWAQTLRTCVVPFLLAHALQGLRALVCSLALLCCIGLKICSPFGRMQWPTMVTVGTCTCAGKGVVVNAFRRAN